MDYLMAAMRDESLGSIEVASMVGKTVFWSVEWTVGSMAAVLDRMSD